MMSITRRSQTLIKSGRGEHDEIMFPSLAELDALGLKQRNWLINHHGVHPGVLDNPEPIQLVKGLRANDGYFEFDNCGSVWLVFREPEDVIFWQPGTDDLATWNGRSFALGEAVIDEAGTYSLGGSLKIHATPLGWLQAGRDGIVVRAWRRCYWRLQDAPRIQVAESISARLKRSMVRAHLPVITVLATKPRVDQ